MAQDRRDLRTTGIEEAKRRSEIIRRYVDIDLPTAGDDRRFADELGLSEDSLVRLATAWRMHRDARLLAGPEVALSREDAPSRDAVMIEEIDMEGVDPDRRQEQLRRIRIIQAHLLAQERGDTDLAAAASEMGVSSARFSSLVKRWRMNASARAMPGAARGVRVWRRNEEERRRRLAILRALLEPDPRTPIIGIHQRLTEECRRQGLQPLSLPRVHGLVREIRRSLLENQSGGIDAASETAE
jgi:hypothetical protein